MASVSKKIKPLWKRQNGKCYFCDCETHLKKKDQKRLQGNTATVEHLIPSVNGGSNRIPNLKMSCHKCNSHRGIMNAVEWFRIASNPERLKKYYDDKLEEKIRKKIAKRSKRKEQILEKFGIYYRFTKISRLEFEELFGAVA